MTYIPTYILVDCQDSPRINQLSEVMGQYNGGWMLILHGQLATQNTPLPLICHPEAISDFFRGKHRRLKYYLLVTISSVGEKYKGKIEIHTSTYEKM
jgi:hypothetical protein